jgi:hypothetical protein
MNLSQQELDKTMAENPDLARANSHGISPQTLASDTIVAKQVIKYQPVIQSLKISEQEFQDTVIEFAHLHGWRICTFRKARVRIKGEDLYRTPFGADGKGMTDAIFTHERWCRFMVVEFKSDVGTLSPEQKVWRRVFIACKIQYRMWRPRDWDTIEKELSGNV